jgi:biopolymer transport protein TolR
MSSGRRLRRDLRGLRSGGAVVLNIVSLIDVFAILVFYLLVNALNAETVPVPPALKLPDSQARAVPKPSVAISISEQEIRLDGRLVGRVEDADTLRRLRAALQASAAASDAQADINIVADKRLPFRVLNTVMTACAGARYGHVSLAVVEKTALPVSAGGA